MMTPSDRKIHLRCSIAEKNERWLERWRLCGRSAQESGGGGEKVGWLGELRELGE